MYFKELLVVPISISPDIHKSLEAPPEQGFNKLILGRHWKPVLVEIDCLIVPIEISKPCEGQFTLSTIDWMQSGKHAVSEVACDTCGVKYEHLLPVSGPWIPKTLIYEIRNWIYTSAFGLDRQPIICKEFKYRTVIQKPDESQSIMPLFYTGAKVSKPDNSIDITPLVLVIVPDQELKDVALNISRQIIMSFMQNSCDFEKKEKSILGF